MRPPYQFWPTSNGFRNTLPDYGLTTVDPEQALHLRPIRQGRAPAGHSCTPTEFFSAAHPSCGGMDSLTGRLECTDEATGGSMLHDAIVLKLFRIPPVGQKSRITLWVKVR